MELNKHYIYNENGEITIIDNRNFLDCKMFQLKYLQETAMKKILAAVPEYKQRNAALGLLTVEENEEIKTFIQNVRNECNLLEEQVNSIVWDGQEETRAAACDAIQSIAFPCNC